MSILSLDEKHAMAFSVVESALENAAVAATGDSETPGKAYGEGERVEGASGRIWKVDFLNCFGTWK